MSNANPQQLEAINKDGCNVIVSAGAGSGKTFILKERVLRMVQAETSINDLIILTFTKKAANEMKDRIRKILTDNKVEDAKYIDSAYISTFDSFSNSLVKKYSYLLDIDKNFNIIDSAIVKTVTRNILDEILEDKYEKQEPKFIKFINNLCYKSDKDLKNDIIDMYDDYNAIVNKEEFFNIDQYYEDEFIDEKLDKYEQNIFYELNKLIEIYQVFVDHAVSEKAIQENNETLNIMQAVTSLDELIDAVPSIKVSTINDKGYDDKEGIKAYKESAFKSQFDEVKKYTTYSKKELKEQYLSTKDDVNELKNIILELDKKVQEFKREHNSYEFNDIAFKAIKLVKNHKEVKDELKKIHEILIDEYQDTNDIQDEFIKQIQNNNLYMVGDIKQSIYGFRNANPSLFKEKYDTYAKGKDGYKIDLISNYRSRGEVIQNINDIFSLIMKDDVGGADYKTSHNMKHGNDNYDKNIDKNVDYNFSIYNYSNEDKKYRKDLIEAYIIADDIEKKMKENRHAFHDEGFIPLQYKDFCILVDKSTNFKTLKNVLTERGIPAYISKKLSIKNDDEIYILKNLITCLISIKQNKYKEAFKHAYASIARSYICKMEDQEIYDAIKNNNFKSTNLYNRLKDISEYIDSLSNKEILYKLLDEFDIINQTIYAGDVEERLAKLEHFIKQADSLNKFGLDIYSMNEYFNDVIDNEDSDIEMELEQSDIDAVTIMTIHGSKGLEFNYVYMPYLYSSFSKKQESKFVMNKELGLLVPFYDEGLDNTFMFNLYKQSQKIDTISEKIRLFYVAITRAKENFILISEFNDKLINNNTIESYDLLKCKSFTDFVTLIKPYFTKNIKYINVDDLNIKKNTIKDVKDYRKLIGSSNETINIEDLNIDYKVLDNKHFSKGLTSLMTQELRDTLDLGTLLHACFEVYDFNKNNLESLSIKEEYKDNIRAFLEHPEVENISNAKVYKEHEIKFNKDGAIYHGYIDLLVEYEDHFDIIDYKTSKIDKIEYVEQLNGYKEYIESKYKKPTNIYLYSIKQDEFKKL